MGRDAILISHQEIPESCKKINGYLAGPFRSMKGLDPSFFFGAPDLGISLLASYLNDRGLDALPLNNPFQTGKDAQLAEELSRSPAVVGISTDHIFFPGTLSEIVAFVKRHSPKSVITAGGAGIEFNPAMRLEGVLNLYGPAEKRFFDLVSAAKKNARREELNRLAALRNETPADEIPFPDYSLYPLPVGNVSVQGSRGCRFSCGFCSYGGRGLELRAPDLVAGEIRRNYSEFAIKFFRFVDADLAAESEWLLKVLGKIKGLPGLHWTCFARADTIREGGLAEEMFSAGCRGVFLGIESGSDRLLTAMNKRTDSKSLLGNVSRIKSAGLMVHGNFVIGYPGEDVETLAETKDFIKRSGLDSVYFSPFQIRSSSIPAYSRKERGLDGSMDSWSHDTMNSREAVEAAEKLLELTVTDKSYPPVSSEIFASYALKSEAGDFVRDFREFSEEIRNWHSASAAGRAGDKERSAEKLKKLLS